VWVSDLLKRKPVLDLENHRSRTGIFCRGLLRLGLVRKLRRTSGGFLFGFGFCLFRFGLVEVVFFILLELIVSLLHQVYKYALKYEIVEKDYSAFLYIPIEDDDESGVPFSEEELKTLWQNKTDPVVETLLIMCYSGFRIAAYSDMETNLDEHFFKGGVKTKASKNRIVPIHPAIQEISLSRHEKYGKNLLGATVHSFRIKMSRKLEELGIEKHTPHDCRHTFSMLCERYNVNENDRKRLMGHSFGADITNQKYGHRTVDDLRSEIEKIEVCY